MGKSADSGPWPRRCFRLVLVCLAGVGQGAAFVLNRGGFRTRRPQKR
jgi:hypothetical protein